MARSAWLRHVMAVRGQNKGMAFKDVLKLAKRSYKKGGSMKGGNKFQSQPASVGGDGGDEIPSNENASRGDDKMHGGEAEAAPQEGGRRRRRSRKKRRGGSKRRSRQNQRKSRRQSRRRKQRQNSRRQSRRQRSRSRR